MYMVIRKSFRNLRTRLRNNQNRHCRKELSSTCKVGQTYGVSPSVDILRFGVTIPATVSQRPEISEGLTNHSVFHESTPAFRTRYGLDGPVIECRWEDKILPTRSDGSWGPSRLLYNG
jgi:hypothetical protein